MGSVIKREVIIGNCRLILGDCLEVMPVLEGFDAICSDPPYGTDPKSAGYGREGLKIANDANLDVCHRAPRMAASHIEDGYIASFYSPRVGPDFLAGMDANHIGQIIWDKKAPGMGGPLRYQHENA